MKKPQREEIRTQSRTTRRTRHHQESSHRVGSRRAFRGTYLDLLGHCSSWRSARSGSRTHTEEDLHRILSPGRLPLSPSGLSLHPRRRTDLHAAAASVQRDRWNVLSLPRAAVQWQHRHARSPCLQPLHKRDIVAWLWETPHREGREETLRESRPRTRRSVSGPGSIRFS